VNLDKDEMAMPENANFYIPNLSREEMDELIQQAKEKKIKFILDGNDKNIVKLKLYNPLLDKYAVFCLNRGKNKNYFKSLWFITEQGKLLYDPTYRESFFVNKNEKNVKNEKDLIDTCRKVKNKNNFKIEET